MNKKQFNTKHHHFAASPVAAAGTPSIAVAIARIEAEQPFPLQRRRATVSALRLLARLCGGTEGTVILDPAVVGPVIKSATPASAGISRASLGAYRVAISSVMRWLGLIDPPNRSHALLGAAWTALRDALPDKFLSMRLQSFMA